MKDMFFFNFFSDSGMFDWELENDQPPYLFGKSKTKYDLGGSGFPTEDD